MKYDRTRCVGALLAVCMLLPWCAAFSPAMAAEAMPAPPPQTQEEPAPESGPEPETPQPPTDPPAAETPDETPMPETTAEPFSPTAEPETPAPTPPAPEATATPTAEPVQQPPEEQATPLPTVSQTPTEDPEAMQSPLPTASAEPGASPLPTESPQPTQTPTPTETPDPEEELPYEEPIVLEPFGLNGFPGGAIARLFAQRRAVGSGLSLDKTVTETATDPETERGIFRLDLTAAAESGFVNVAAPRDVVLVLDTSRSMQQTVYEDTPITGAPDTSKTYGVKIGSTMYEAKYNTRQRQWRCNNTQVTPKSTDPVRGVDFYPLTTRMDAMKAAVAAYLQAAAVSNTDSRVDIITFSGSAADRTGGFWPLCDSDGVNDALLTVLDGLDVEWTTQSALGLQAAQRRLAATQDLRDPVIILFTDGVPSTNGGFSTSIAQSAIQTASTIKKNWQATVFAVGVFSDLGQDQSNVYRYMHRISGNYTDATTLTNGTPTVAVDDSRPHDYFRTAENAAQLAEIFTSIAQQTGTALTGATVRDSITADFIPCRADGTALAEGERIDSTGAVWQTGGPEPMGTVCRTAEGGWYIAWTGVTLAPPAAPGQSGTDFAAAVYIRPADSCPGGNAIYTNGTDSGIYNNNGDLLESFPMPQVNVPLHLPSMAAEGVYFLGETIERTEIQEALDGNKLYDGPLALDGTFSTPELNRSGSTTPESDVVYTATTQYTPARLDEPAAVGTPCTVQTVREQYTAHILEGQFTLRKVLLGGTPTRDAHQATPFCITGPTGTFFEVIRGGGSVTVVGLPAGEYTVTELTGWSWRHLLSGVVPRNDGLTGGVAAPTGNSATLTIGAPAEGGLVPAESGADYTGTVENPAAVSFTDTNAGGGLLSDTTWVVNDLT